MTRQELEELQRKRILKIEEAQTELQRIISDAVLNNIPKQLTKLKVQDLIKNISEELKDLKTDDEFIESVKKGLIQTFNKWNAQVISQLIKVQKQANLDVLNETIANMKGNNPTIARAKRSGGITIANNLVSQGEIKNMRDFITHVEDGGAARYVDYVSMVKNSMTKISNQIADGTLMIKDRRGLNKSLRGMAEIKARYDIINDDLKRLNERGVKLVIASSHPNASERCSWWQGKIFKVDFDVASREMAEYKGQPKQTIIGYIDGKPIYSLKQACENGFLSYNCQHRLVAYYKGARPKQYNLVEVEKRRNLSQTQRYLERRIRQARARQEIAVTPEAQLDMANIVKDMEKQYRKFSKDNKLPVFTWRTEIV